MGSSSALFAVRTRDDLLRNVRWPKCIYDQIDECNSSSKNVALHRLLKSIDDVVDKSKPNTVQKLCKIYIIQWTNEGSRISLGPVDFIYTVLAQLIPYGLEAHSCTVQDHYVYGTLPSIH